MRWDWHVIAYGAAVVVLGFALAFLEGAHLAIERAQTEAAAVDR